MSIKNLFGKQSNKVLNATNLEQMSQDVESTDLIQASIEDKNRFIPKVDYSDPKNFARYGSAKQYYYDAIRSIWKTYPYDGSLAEQMKWHNSSSDLTNYIFEEEYPKNNGFVTIGRTYGSSATSSLSYEDTNIFEYIQFKGGPNTFLTASNKKELFDKANKVKLVDNRGSNLELNGHKGATVEFYFQKSNTQGSPKQVIFDSWNNVAVGQNDYGRFKVEIRPGLVGQNNKFYIEVSSGSAGVIDAALGSDLTLISNDFNHYAITVQNLDGSLKLQLFKNGDLNQEFVTGSSIGAVSGSMLAHIGALITNAPGSSALKGWGKLSGSIDEFRYWKAKRTDKEISRNWFTHVGGGANTDLANTDLGVYFKFNEGIYNPNAISSFDTNVLDYSGRISNGYWVGYSVGSRNLNSAIVLAGAADFEQKDPVMYSSHPDVVALSTRLESSGTLHDLTNNAALYNSFPEYMVDEDSQSGEGLKELSQIMAEFFDNLHLKIEALPTIREMAYRDGKPLPFAKKLLESVGFQTPDIFVDSSILETFLARDEDENFTDKIHNVKNAIYENIYNNLIYIYRSKGSEKAIRNLFRCFGIDDELIKINLYADGTKFLFDDRFQYVTERKKYVDFNHVDRFDSVVYQMTASGDPNSVSYINGTSQYFLGTTLEGEAIFPRKFVRGEPFYFSTDFVSCSLFGIHEAASTVSDLTWQTPDRANIQIYAVRPEEESKNVRFHLTSSLGVSLTSDLYYDVYDDQKWNFAVRLKHEKYPYSHSDLLGSQNGNYILEFYGINAVQDIIQQEFILSATVAQNVAENYFNARKRIYVGAHRVDFNGTLNTGPGTNNEQMSDAKISSIRFWHSVIQNEIIRLHAQDVFNFGPESPYSNIDSYLSTMISGVFVPQIDTLTLHWDFETVTGSDNGAGTVPTNATDAGFTVLDISSGSLTDVAKGPLGDITKYHYTGRGDKFPRNDSDVVSREYVYSGKRRLPETLNSNDMTNILSQDDEVFTKDSVPVNYYFSLEKSMYQNISEEMLKWLGTITDFNNIIGKPHLRYESEYNGLIKLRQLFFKNVDNTPDFERFVDFYKWIDDSVTKIVQQLIPGSMNVSDKLSNVVESHIFERNKYRHKLPTLEFVGDPPIGAAKTIGELKYNWRTGHAPTTLINNQDESCLWWNKRATRIGQLNSAREGIFTAITQVLNRSFTTVYDFSCAPIVKPAKKERSVHAIKSAVGFNRNDFIMITTGQTGSFNLEKIDCDDI